MMRFCALWVSGPGSQLPGLLNPHCFKWSCHPCTWDSCCFWNNSWLLFRSGNKNRILCKNLASQVFVRQIFSASLMGLWNAYPPSQGRAHCHKRHHWHCAVSQSVLMQLHTLFPSLSKTSTNYCQEKSFSESIGQLPLHGREQLQVISLQLLSMSCASLGWFLYSTSLLSHSCPIADKVVSFRKIIDLMEVQRDGEMTRVGFFVWFCFFFQRNSHPCAMTASLQNSGAAEVQSWPLLLSRKCERQGLRVS